MFSSHKHHAQGSLAAGRGPPGSPSAGRQPAARQATPLLQETASPSCSDGEIYSVFQLGNSLQVFNKREKQACCWIFGVHLVLRILIPLKK